MIKNSLHVVTAPIGPNLNYEATLGNDLEVMEIGRIIARKLMAKHLSNGVSDQGDKCD